jgi:hypothetical protein
LFSAWLRNWPDIGSLPVNSHCRVIEGSYGAASASRRPFYSRERRRQAVQMAVANGRCTAMIDFFIVSG